MLLCRLKTRLMSHPEIFSVCVFCGARMGNDPAYKAAAQAVGQWIGERGYRLVFGGGQGGLMGVVADSALAANQQLMETLIQHYGRTCRRYYFDSRIPIPALAHVGRFSWHQETIEATMSTRAIADAGARLAVFDHHAATLEAHA